MKKKEELAQKESILLKDLNQNSSKAKKVALWALGAGAVALVGYGIYRSFSSEKPPKESNRKKTSKREKRGVPKDSPIVDTAIENLAPSIGKWLLKQFKY